MKKILGIVSLMAMLTGCVREVNTPKIELIGSKEYSMMIGDKYVDPGCTAKDKEDGDLTDKIKVSGWNGDTTKVGAYIRVYTVEDSDGHEESITRKILIFHPCNE